MSCGAARLFCVGFWKFSLIILKLAVIKENTMTNRAFPVFITCLFAIVLFLAGCTPPPSIWDEPQTTTPTRPVDRPATAPPAGAYLPADGTNVALLLPLSGSNAALGQSMLQAAQLALFEIDDPKFNLVPRDTQGTAAGAAAAARSAIDDGAELILGPVFADSVKAVQPVARQQNVNIIAFSTDWTLADPSTYLMGFMPFSQVERIASYAADQGITNVAIVAAQDKYGDLVTGRFDQAFRRRGGNVSGTVRINPNDPELSSRLAAVPANSQGVFMPLSGQYTQAVSDYLAQAGLPPTQARRLGTGLWDNPAIASQRAMQGGWFAGPSPSGRQSFERKYADTYGQQPVRLATLAYDATALAATLARNGNGFTSSAISDPNGFAGTDGVFRFGRGGIVERKLAILELQNGRIVEIDPAGGRF
jgi:ABC-type branched-subunit amino acid transport system substrate-binding protein